MLFQSLEFLIFFPVVVLAYYVVPRRFKTPWLLLASYFYYMCWDYRYMAFLLFSTVSTYFAGKALEKENARRKLILTICVAVNVGLLVVFKYTHFAIDSINFLLRRAGITLIPNKFSLILPIGISFYTLQAAGYLFDVYRKKIPAEQSFLTYALFVSFFPQVLSGPIGRAGPLLPQLHEPKPYDFERVRSGLLRLLWGFFVKLVITERLNILANTVFDSPEKYSGISCVLAAVAYGLQIYCDFSSYTNMALGAGEVLGIELMENFKTPYFSQSVAEFWRRWHISLSSWFRDYVYIPLGGSRKGTARKYLNVMIVFTLSGLWHGANWTFVVWGALNGLFQVIEAMLKAPGERLTEAVHAKQNTEGKKVFRMLLTFVLVDFNWIFFRADSMSKALALIKNMVVFNSAAILNKSWLKLGLDGVNFTLLIVALLLHLLVSIANYNGIVVRKKITEQGIVCRWLVYYVALFAVIIFGIYGPAYDAGSFIYSKF